MDSDSLTAMGNRLVKAYNGRDYATLGELFEDGATWHSASGDQVGRAAILAALRSVDERSGGTFHEEPHDVLASREHIVLLSRASGRRGDRTIDDPEVVVFHVREGRVSEAWSHPFDQRARSSFWS